VSSLRFLRKSFSSFPFCTRHDCRRRFSSRKSAENVVIERKTRSGPWTTSANVWRGFAKTGTSTLAPANRRIATRSVSRQPTIRRETLHDSGKRLVLIVNVRRSRMTPICAARLSSTSLPRHIDISTVTSLPLTFHMPMPSVECQFYQTSVRLFSACYPSSSGDAHVSVTSFPAHRTLPTRQQMHTNTDV
jgi:hypothetical protein